MIPCKINIDSATFNNFSFEYFKASKFLVQVSGYVTCSKLSKLQGKLEFYFRSGQDIHFLFLFCFFFTRRLCRKSSQRVYYQIFIHQSVARKFYGNEYLICRKKSNIWNKIS